MKIEKMTSAHIDEVHKIETDCFAHPWSCQSIESELANPNSHFWVATEDSAVVGYIGMSVVVDEGYIFNVAVDESCRRRGIATALINQLVTFGKKNNLCFITLEVRESNESARSLYSNFGFIRVGERKNYYSEPSENAILMTKYFDIN